MSKQKNKWIALVLAMAGILLGYLYLGKFTNFILINLITMSAWLSLRLIDIYVPIPSDLFAVLWILIWLFAIYDCYKLCVITDKFLEPLYKACLDLIRFVKK